MSLLPSYSESTALLCAHERYKIQIEKMLGIKFLEEISPQTFCQIRRSLANLAKMLRLIGGYHSTLLYLHTIPVFRRFY